MKKTYHAPSLDGLGAVHTLTAAFGTDPSPDINEISQQVGTGSFDICQQQGGDPSCGT